MDLARLTELEKLFGRRYQALALLCLHQEGPMRWADIARAMQRRADEHINDKEVTRSLKALQAAGCVDQVPQTERVEVRVLTSAGVRRAERMLDIITKFDM